MAGANCVIPRTIAPALSLLVLAVAAAGAQEIEPRTYVNTPVGVNFLIAGYGYADGGLSVDPSLPLEDAEIQSDAIILGYARSFGFMGRSAKVSVNLPYAWTSGYAKLDGERRERDVNGLLDPTFLFSVALWGAPALTLREFAAYRQDLIVGASVRLRLPWGQYDPEKFLNNGTNRWSVKPEIGMSKAWGQWRVEISGAFNLIGDNREFLGDGTLEQDPVYSVQGHLIYDFPSGIWLAADATWYRGGRTTIDGERQDNLQRNSRVGLTAALPLGRHHSLKLYGSTGVSTRIGSDSDILGVAWQYRWGGGL